MVYVLSKIDLTVKDIINPISHNLCEDSLVTVKSELRISKSTKAMAGDYVIFNEKGSVLFSGIVDTVTGEKGTSIHTLYILPMLSLFDRKIVLDNESMTGTTGIEDFIVYTIQSQFKASGDGLTDLVYLDPIAMTHTVEAIKPENENGIWNLATFIRYIAKRYGVLTSFEVMRDKQLTMSIEKIVATTKKIDATLADIVNYNETMDVDTISKVYIKTGNGSIYTYYLFDDGSYSIDPLAGTRVPGRITSVYVENDADADKTAGDVFSANRYNHCVEFEILKESELFDVEGLKLHYPVRLRTQTGGVYDTYISARSQSSDRKTVGFKCGDMRISLTDKLKMGG